MPTTKTLYEQLSDSRKTRYDYILGLANESELSARRLTEVADMWKARASAIRGEVAKMKDRSDEARWARAQTNIREADAEAERATENAGNMATRAIDMTIAAEQILHA